MIIKMCLTDGSFKPLKMSFIVLCYYYPNLSSPCNKIDIAHRYISKLPAWIENVKTFLPSFKIILYCEIDIFEDPYIPETVKNTLSENLHVVTLKRLSHHFTSPLESNNAATYS